MARSKPACEPKQIDTRDLSHPEPLEKILEAVNTLELNQLLVMKHSRIPYPLFPILEEKGCSFEVDEISETEFNISIWKNQP